MEYNVVNAKGEFLTCEVYDPYYYSGRSNPLVLTSVDAAKGLAESYSLKTGEKWFPKPIPDLRWKQRESHRLLCGPYEKLPDWFPTLYEHFAHRSIIDPDKLFYTENEEKGQLDRQTVVRAGKYLKKHFPELDGQEIADLVARYCQANAPLELKFATTADEIEHVYTNGPSSCMGYTASDFSSPFHPVRVYGDSDLELAYIERDGAIKARCLVWRSAGHHSTIYGDRIRIEPLLTAAGFVAGDFKGARIRKEKNSRGHLIAPYLDGYRGVKDDGEWLVICGGNWDHYCDSTSGLIDCDTVSCDNCGDAVDEDDTCTVNHDETWCECCSDETYLCDMTLERLTEDLIVHMANGEVWSASYYSDHGFLCEGTNRHYPADNSVVLEDDTLWCTSYFEDHGFVCSETGECWPNDRATEINGDLYGPNATLTIELEAA